MILSLSNNSRPPMNPSRQAVTLVELLVVITITSMLLGITVPAVNRAREACRSACCQNNLKQVALAMQCHENQFGYFPTSLRPTADGKTTVDGWSALAQVLPHLEQGTLVSNMDLGSGYLTAGHVTTADGETTRLASLRVPTFVCPSESRDEPRVEAGEPSYYPSNYAVNLGTWFVYDPRARQRGDGAFLPAGYTRAADLEDGLSNTLCLAEVRAWTSYFQNKGLTTAPSLKSASDVCGLGGKFAKSFGHTQWVDGRAHQTGFTTTLTPNAKVHCKVGGEADLDWTNQAEGTSNRVPTWAAITARSYHYGMVNVAMMDGSVRPIEDGVNLQVWRAISTRAASDTPSQEP